MVDDVYQYMYLGIRVYLPVHLAAIACIDSYSNSCGVDCTDIRVCSLGLLGLSHGKLQGKAHNPNTSICIVKPTDVTVDV